MNYYQNKINKILLVGLGGVGTVYADLLTKASFDLRILVDKNRLNNYKKSPRFLNDILCDFKYILPTDEFEPDLIIIATKSNGLKDSIEEIKPFVKKHTLIMSFINGISSEEILTKHFSVNQIIHSYIICHTITRINNNVIHDGITKIVWGDKNNNQANINRLNEFFCSSQLNNEFSNNIIADMWKKFCFNCCVNQISAVTGYTFAEIQNDKECLTQIKHVSEEINTLANKIGIKGLNLVESSFEYLKKMIPNGKTSMLQDIESNRTPEIDLFGAEVIRLAEEYNVNIPYNKLLFDKLNTKLT